MICVDMSLLLLFLSVLISIFYKSLNLISNINSLIQTNVPTSTNTVWGPQWFLRLWQNRKTKIGGTVELQQISEILPDSCSLHAALTPRNIIYLSHQGSNCQKRTCVRLRISLKCSSVGCFRWRPSAATELRGWTVCHGWVGFTQGAGSSEPGGSSSKSKDSGTQEPWVQIQREYQSNAETQLGKCEYRLGIR